MACIAGGIAEAYYGDILESILSEVRRILDPSLLDIANKFYEKYIFPARA